MLVFNIAVDPGNPPLQKIIDFAETWAVTGDVVKEYIITRLLEDENVLAEVCEEAKGAGESLRAAALKDIGEVMAALEAAKEALGRYTPSIRRSMHFAGYQKSLEAIVAADSDAALLEGIIAHYCAFGGGKRGKHIAFVWNAGLEGIEKPDDITLDQLYCLDRQRQEIQENTEAFLKGLPRNNVLLYGNSGCGKSSMVKAILNEYYQEGLRLVQLRKEDLAQLPLLIRQIKGRRFRFIVYMDDLSFESDDLGYKTLKTILDGSVEKQPDNIVFYATSNRLHLINESWAERKGNEVHVSDTRNEKMSLSERFGIRLSFLSPGQREYLGILEGILADAGIKATEVLKAEAVNWAWQCNGLSGRTAMQFVNTVMGRKG